MPGQNAELVRVWFERLAAGDLAEDLWHSDLVVENVETLVFEATYRGHEGLRRWWDDLTEVFSDASVELEHAEELDDGRVLSRQRLRGRFKATGIDFDDAWWAVGTVRDGKLARVKGYSSKKRALRDAGLRP